MKNQIFFATIIISTILYTITTRYKTSSYQPQEKPLIIGIAAQYAPFVSINQYGEYEGFDIDVAQALAKKLQRKIQFRDIGSMVPLFISLEQGSIDMIMWGLSITQERLQNVAMIHYQGNPSTAYPLLFWQTIPNNVRSLENMQGMTICVEPYSAQEALLNQYPFITKIETEKVDDALLHIQYKKADAALVEPAIAQKFKQKYPESIKTLTIPLPADKRDYGIGIAIKKNNLILATDVQQAIDELKADGTIATYEKKWLLS